MNNEKPVQLAINQLIKQIFTDERTTLNDFEKILTDVGLTKLGTDLQSGIVSWNNSKVIKDKRKLVSGVGGVSPRSKTKKASYLNSTLRIGLRTSSTMMSHIRIFVGLLVPLVAWSIVGGIMQIGEVRNSLLKLNMITVYANTALLWNTNACAQTALFNLLMWQPTKLVLGQNAASSFEQLLSRLENQVIPTYQYLLSQNLDNYTEVYQNMMNGDFNLTKVGQTTNSTFFNSGTGTGASEYMNFNILTTIKQDVTILERIYAEWKLTKGDVVASRNIFKSPGYKTFFFYSTYLDALNIGAITNCYYSLVLPLVPGISVIASQSLLGSQVGLNVPIVLLAFLLISVLFFVPLFNIPNLETKILYLFRLELLVTNQILVKSLKTYQK